MKPIKSYEDDPLKKIKSLFNQLNTIESMILISYLHKWKDKYMENRKEIRNAVIQTHDGVEYLPQQTEDSKIKYFEWCENLGEYGLLWVIVETDGVETGRFNQKFLVSKIWK